MTEKISRRTFTKVTAAATLGLTAASAKRVLGANDRIRLGFIGVANRGSQLLTAFKDHSQAEIAGLCDVSEASLGRARERFGQDIECCRDFRQMLQRKDLDAVVIATPDHWHAIQTIAACNAGKDVYVEKPVSITVHEGRKMIEVARRTGRIVQVGLHRRSSALYAEVAKRVQADLLGKVTVCRCYHLSNMYPAGIGKAQPAEPPADLDWDMWLGPRPLEPFRETIAPYKFRWWMLYSSQIANNGVHHLDVIRWMTGDGEPVRIAAMGGRFAVDDDRTIPDTMQVTFQTAPGRLVLFGQYEANGNPALPQPGYCELRGTQGTAYTSDSVVRVIPEKGGQFQDHQPRMEPTEFKAEEFRTEDHRVANLSLTSQHAGNFLDCMRSRATPKCDVEVGHTSTTYALLANIALVTGATLEWDPVKEVFTNNSAANDLLHYEYRKPWKLDG
ncbi:MAG: Gfo/Idh/MocA family oxidoreductase [Rhodopirellula sp.]|nr:Gfo/Idh/MocA family oxidoreductase [Rhodopirellula sp.]